MYSVHKRFKALFVKYIQQLTCETFYEMVKKIYIAANIPISNETDRDKQFFGFWSHLTRFNAKYKANAKTFLTSDCTFTQWRAPWWKRSLFVGSCLLPINTLHKLVPPQTRYRYHANWHPYHLSVIHNLFIIVHYTYKNIQYGHRYWLLRSLYVTLPKCS